MRRDAVALFTVAVLAFSAQLFAHEGHGHKIMGTIAAVEAGLALGLVVLLYKRQSSLDSESWTSMWG